MLLTLGRIARLDSTLSKMEALLIPLAWEGKLAENEMQLLLDTFVHLRLQRDKLSTEVIRHKRVRIQLRERKRERRLAEEEAQIDELRHELADKVPGIEHLLQKASDLHV